MRIGIVGLGVVGSACKFGFELIGHTVSYHDTKDGTSINDIKETDISTEVFDVWDRLTEEGHKRGKVFIDEDTSD